MGVYHRYVLPPVIDWVMRTTQLNRLRREVVSEAWGNVVEIGIGSGLNLRHYPASVRSVVGVDPSPGLLARARVRAGEVSFPVELAEAAAERLPFADATFDTAVSTWSLCSIPHAEVALGEIRRVLKPGAKLLFVEHGLAPDAPVARWQARLTPMWRPLAGGCHLDRKIDDIIARAGFRVVALEAFYGEGFRVTGFTYRGAAEPA